MRYTSALILAAAAFASAQSTSSAAAASSSSTSSSGTDTCGPQLDLTIETCLTSTQPQVKACDANDWTCLCAASQAVDTCYNNCPSHPDAFGQQQTTTSYCNAAKAYSSSTTSGSHASTATGGSTATNAAASTSGDSNTAIQTDFAAASGSDAAGASASQSGNSASGFAPAGGLFAAIIGLALI